ncbi:hypothetical protein ADK57_05120 [Streptomyces sp. MMG1533]|uniref:hypothetical protein n=1 Tax=Streptomyces sp. MMG1533 TaxID=1415546 RepID=UPI0006AF0BCD|nr:hypothetical protein [Streptomyces sp. MMG1533]KOU76287.1 hypothetical protein ADK57_05120 [Streptomyces sp. MMG1533]
MTSRRRKQFMREAYQRQAQRERAQRELEEPAQLREEYPAFLRSMEELKYKRPDPLPPASMSKNADRLPLFWLAYFTVPIAGTWLLIQILDWWERL